MLVKYDLVVTFILLVSVEITEMHLHVDAQLVSLILDHFHDFGACLVDVEFDELFSEVASAQGGVVQHVID